MRRKEDFHFSRRRVVRKCVWEVRLAVEGGIGIEVELGEGSFEGLVAME